MSFDTIYQAGLREMNEDYDMSPQLAESLLKNEELRSRAQFIYRQLEQRLKLLCAIFQKSFQLKITDLNSGNETTCGFIYRCYTNGYRQFCDLPCSDHDRYLAESQRLDGEVRPVHTYQKKNINNMIDSQYQEGILTIENFIAELTSSLIAQTIKHYLLEQSKEIKINYSDGDRLQEYDQLMLESPNYYRLNYLRDGMVTYYCLGDLFFRVSP